jgi:hypothetical protein
VVTCKWSRIVRRCQFAWTPECDTNATRHADEHAPSVPATVPLAASLIGVH